MQLGGIWESWRAPDGDPVGLLHPAPDGTLRAWPVSRAVNAARNNGPELIEPIPIRA